MLRILYFIIGVTVNVVHQEAEHLLVGDIYARKGEMLNFDRGENRTHFRQIALHIGLEHRHTERHPVEVPVVFGSGVREGAQGVSRVVEKGGGHHCVQVNRAQQGTILRIEEEVADFRVVVSYARRDFTAFIFCPETEHLFASGFYPGDFFSQVLDSSGLVRSQGFVPLGETPAYVVESLDDFAQRLLEIANEQVELAESQTALVGKLLGICSVVAPGAFYKQAYCPEIALVILIIEFAVKGRDDGKGLAKRVRNLGLDMLRDLVYVLHHCGNVREYKVVFPLKDVLRLRTALHIDKQGVVDKALSEGFDSADLAFNAELGYDFSFHGSWL